MRTTVVDKKSDLTTRLLPIYPRHAGASRAILIKPHDRVRLMYFYRSVVVSSLEHFRSYNSNKFERRYFDVYLIVVLNACTPLPTCFLSKRYLTDDIYTKIYLLIKVAKRLISSL